MRILILIGALLFAFNSWATEYVVVSVSGFRTIRHRDEVKNVFSRRIDPKGEPSGVWRYAPLSTRRNHILATTFLTHFSSKDELNSVLRLFKNEEGECRTDVKMILIANSWGAAKSQKLAKLLYKQCQSKPLMTYILEGIRKPTNFAYRSEILSEQCINIFQRRSMLRGNTIKNCRNYEIDYSAFKKTIYDSHIDAEWDASPLIQESILNFLNAETKNFVVNTEGSILRERN